MSGILKCGGRVQTKVVINTKTETLMLLVISKVESDSVFTRIVIVAITH